MTPEQHQRWLELSVGLARHGFPNMTERRRAKLVAEVASIVEFYEGRTGVEDWDGNAGDTYVCDEMLDLTDEHYHGENGSRRNRFLGQIEACVRAGFDVAIAPSAGVLGYFSVGDLRRVFDGQPPEWVQSFFEAPITADVPDAMGVWL